MNKMKNFETWLQSSLLGANIRAFMHCWLSVCLELRIFWITGIENAAVFPEPVLALTKTSFPSNSNGMAFSWTKVGDSHLNFAIAYYNIRINQFPYTNV